MRSNESWDLFLNARRCLRVQSAVYLARYAFGNVGCLMFDLQPVPHSCGSPRPCREREGEGFFKRWLAASNPSPQSSPLAPGERRETSPVRPEFVSDLK